ncbi:MAG: 5-formyltetrahydrofolate cyclo-ligase [Candidatus Gottesmanbacteria bacterium]|nr:5-formyltetrahydrofolate cyclo-ligase [Candidatus Gottesmanbacteria bacterium]
MFSADTIICNKVMSLPQWTKAETVCLYFSRPEEVDTKPLLAAALTAEKTVVFPAIAKDTLILHHVVSIKDFVMGKYNILEPKKSTPIVDPANVDLFIVPGVVFDRKGNRMGHGKGYYDKLLAGISTPKIGLAYAVQLIAELPRSSYDVPMNVIITEEEIYAF